MFGRWDTGQPRVRRIATHPAGTAMPLTKRQREILNYLTVYSERNGYAPSFEEIAEHFNYNSLATVHEHLTNIERKGVSRSANAPAATISSSG